LEGVAASFTPTVNYTLSQIDLAFASVEDFNSAITVSLETNYTSDTVIESWNLSGPFPAAGSTDNTLQTITPTGTVSLTAGTEYWLVAAPQNDYTEMLWNTTTASYPPGTTTKLFDSDCNCWVNEEEFGPATFHRGAGDRRNRAACAV
jgi:hypothetical protein